MVQTSSITILESMWQKLPFRPALGAKAFRELLNTEEEKPGTETLGISGLSMKRMKSNSVCLKRIV